VISDETFTVTLVPAENGTYSINPKIPDDGKVPAGTVLSVTAKPSSGFSLDAMYYTVKGGMWGTTSYESFSPTMKITVNKDMSVGATLLNVHLWKTLTKHRMSFMLSRG
jgi:acetyl esterase